jgi:hypothetical protein
MGAPLLVFLLLSFILPNAPASSMPHPHSFVAYDASRSVGRSEGKSAQKQTTFQNTSMGEIIDEDGVHMGFTHVKASDGNRLTVLYEDFANPADAGAFFAKQIAKAAKLVERKDRLGPDGTVVGERAEILLSVHAGKATSAILWTDGDKFHEIISTSRRSILELERAY